MTKLIKYIIKEKIKNYMSKLRFDITTITTTAAAGTPVIGRPRMRIHQSNKLNMI